MSERRFKDRYDTSIETAGPRIPYSGINSAFNRMIVIEANAVDDLISVSSRAVGCERLFLS